MSRFAIVVGALAVSLAGSLASAVVAHAGDETVMTGLHNPRGLTFAVPGGHGRADREGRRSALYVAEAGTGGTRCGAEVRGPVCVGTTGSISRYQGGEQRRVVEGLPSYTPFSGANAGAVGPSDVSVAGRRGYVAIGLAANVSARPALEERFGWIARFRADGTVAYTTDVSAYEQQANPDAGLLESNPYGLLAGAGERLVVDAAGNSLLSVHPSGRITTAAVFPSRPAGRGTDAVPTAVVTGPDGAYYVGELTGSPFAPAQATVWRMVPGQPPSPYCTGFSFIIDLAFDQHGRLYVLEHASGPLGPFAGTPGRLLRVHRDCSAAPVRTGLAAPTSIAMGPDGDAYVSINGNSATDGAVIRVALRRREAGSADVMQRPR